MNGSARRMSPSLAAAALAVSLTWGASAAAEAPTGSVAGTVALGDGLPAPGVQVRVGSLDGGREVAVTSGAAGAYEVRGLSPGAYRVTANLPGLSEGVKTVSVRAGGHAVADFELSPGGVRDDVTVTAEKIARPVSETPQTVTIVNAEEIDQRRPMSTQGAYEKTPNLIPVEANPARERPRLRGLSANRVLILVDGERLNNNRTDSGAAGLSPSVVDVTNLESVEVVSGSGSSLYGTDSVAGTINLRTKEPARPGSGYELRARLDGTYQSNGDWRRGAASAEYATSRFAFRLSASEFRLGESYQAGAGEVSQAENVSFGTFANGVARSVGPTATGIANTYPVYSLGSRGGIPNSGGQGFNDQLDAWWFLSDQHTVRFRMLNSQHVDLGSAFSVPPYDPDTRSNSFRRLDKYSLRYEGKDLSDLVKALSVGGYFQKFSFPQNDYLQSIVAGSSYRTNAAGQYDLTGNLSAFAPASNTVSESRLRSTAADATTTIKPAANLTVTAGAQYFQDDSSDKFDRQTFGPGGAVTSSIVAGKSNPDTLYRNVGAFAQAEYEPVRWLRLGGGIRLDRWRTVASPSQGFPLGTELANLEAAYPQLQARPLDVNVAGVDGIQAVAAGTGSLSTTDTPVTGNASAVVRLPYGINPYLRWANSFREPSITERYIMRDFGTPAFAVVGLPNARLLPEKGNSVDAGVKVQNPGYSASAGYFRNALTDFISTVYSNSYMVPADPGKGLLPLYPGGPHGVVFFQRANVSRALITGWEATGELAVPAGSFGGFTPGVTLGWLHGTNQTPTQTKINIMDQWYNRTDTPIKLEGSPGDVPLGDITPFRGTFSLRYASRLNRFFAEWETRYQTQVTRVEPEVLATANFTTYGTMASFGSITRHSVRMGYNFPLQGTRVSVTVACENVTDRFYWEQFTQTPARGRTFVVGVTTDFFAH